MRDFFVDTRSDHIVINYVRRAGAAELRAAFLELSRGEPRARRLHDLQHGLELDSQAAREIAWFSEQLHVGPARCALVVPDSFSFGLARMCQAYRENEEFLMEVFRSEEEARVWLFWPLPPVARGR